MTLKTKRFSLYPLRAFRNILGRLKFVPTKYAEIIFLKYGFHLQIKQFFDSMQAIELSKVSLLGVDSLWVDWPNCTFIPADWGSK